jgi:hypothetical protein
MRDWLRVMAPALAAFAAACLVWWALALWVLNLLGVSQ